MQQTAGRRPLIELPPRRNALRVIVSNTRQRLQLEHRTGPLEFGRGPQQESQRCVIEDSSVSRDQLRVEHTAEGRLQLCNLSSRVPLMLADGREVPPGESLTVDYPIRLSAGTTLLEFAAPRELRSGGALGGMGGQREGLETVQPPVAIRGGLSSLQQIMDRDREISPETLTQWFETMITVQRAAASSSEFYQETAQAVVDLVGLDVGMVLLLRDGEWETAACAQSPTAAHSGHYSRNVLQFVVEEKRTFFEDIDLLPPSASLTNVNMAVASPIFAANGDQLAGVVYGSRAHGTVDTSARIRPLEAQLVQVLAAAVGAGLARLDKEAEAARRRVLFEQFFSTALARELDRNPQMLDGRNKDVTVLFADIRRFTQLSAQLGPWQACQLVGDIMDRLTDHVVSNDGVVVDYYGDGMLAMWNAPVDQPDHAERACRAALSIVGELPAIGAKWDGKIPGPISVGIGINSGEALVGNTGSNRKFKYGPLGLTVNTAQRIEASTKLLGVPVVISGATYERLGGCLQTRRLCQAQLSGVPDPVDLYELRSTEPDPGWLRIKEVYEQALAFYEGEAWGDAWRTLSPLFAGHEHDFDVPSLNLMSRTLDCLRTPPSPFDRSFSLRTK